MISRFIRAVLTVIAFVFFAFVGYRCISTRDKNDYDSLGRAFVRESIQEITTSWDLERLKKRSDYDLKQRIVSEEEKYSGLFDRYRSSLGSFVKIDDITRHHYSSSWNPKDGKVIRILFVLTVRFEKGGARIRIRVEDPIPPRDYWYITSFDFL